MSISIINPVNFSFSVLGNRVLDRCVASYDFLANPSEMFSRVWVGKALDILQSPLTIPQMNKLFYDDHYYIRLLSLASAHQQGLDFQLERSPREVLQTYKQYKKLEGSIPLAAGVLRKLAQKLPFEIFPMHRLDNTYQLVGWPACQASQPDSLMAVMAAGIAGRQKHLAYQGIPRQIEYVQPVYLWQLIHDLDVVVSKFGIWQQDPKNFMRDLAGEHLIRWRTHAGIQEVLKDFERLNDLEKCQRIYSLMKLPEVGKREEELARSWGVGCVIINPFGEVIALGHDGPPLPLEFKSDSEVRGFFKVKGSKKDKFSTKEFGLRRSICSEQKAIISAVINGYRLEGATVYSNLGPPCSQCMLFLVNFGIKRYIFPKDRGKYGDRSSSALRVLTAAQIFEREDTFEMVIP